jgi:hypothetical protein
MAVSPYVQFLENWIPGIGETTALHDSLHSHFKLDYSVNSEARLLGFQLGHHPAGNFFHVLVFSIISTTIYPSNYKNSWKDIQSFYSAYLLGKYFQSVPYWACPVELLQNMHVHQK